MEESIPKKPLWKKILLGIGVAAGLVAIYFLFFFKASIEIKVEPNNALLEIDNRQHSIGINKVKPGNREIKISAPGYETFQKRMVIQYFSNQPFFLKLKKIPLLKKLDHGKISFLDYNQEKNFLYYIKNQAAYRINLNQENSKPEKISKNFFKNLKYLVWAKDNQGAVAKLGDKTYYYDFGRYNLLNQTVKFWGRQIGSFALAPDRQRIAYFQSTTGPEKSLVLSNTQHSSSQRVAKLKKFSHPQLSWQPNRQYILILEKYRVNIYDTYSDELSRVAVGGPYQEGVVTPDSERILYATPTPASQPALSLMNLEGKERENLNINASFKEIDWLDSENFCGVGQKDGQLLLFCYNITEEPENALTELSWQEPSQADFRGLTIDQKNQKIYLIRNDQLESITMVNKGY